MATASFYTFSKRKNSTAQPTSGNTDIDVVLKSGTSLMSPTFLLNYSSRPGFNYVKFEDRYYFIEDIVSVRNNLWEIVCSADPLATWKNVIGSTNAMILYATGGRDDIIDKRMCIESDVTIHNQDASIPNFSISQLGVGTAVLSVTGLGCLGDYIISKADIAHMIEGVDAWWSSQGITTVEQTLQQFFYGGNAAENIKNMIGLPYSITYSDYSANIGPQEQLYLGKYPATNNGAPIMVHKINNPIVKKSVSVSIPWEYSDWRRHSPYTTVTLYLPLIGLIRLSSDELVNVGALDIDYSFNISSGDISVEVSIDNPYKIIYTGSNNVAMAMTYGSAAINSKMMVSGIVTGVAGIAAAGITAASGGSLAVAGGALFGGITSAASGLIYGDSGMTSGAGGLTGGASQGLYNKILVMTFSQMFADTQSNINPLMGKPVMGKNTINSYSGFVQTSGLSVAGNMTDTERDIINSTFDRGAYYE